MDSRKYKSYEFPTIEESFFLDKSISKYEIPQYIQDIPEGFSLFCTLWEASKVKQYMLLSQDEQDKLNIKETYDKKEKENLINEEPIPKNNFCYICQQNFEDYLSHLESKDHKANLYNQNPSLIKSIKTSFKRINKFWSNDISNDNSSITNNEISSNESIDEEEDSNEDKSTPKEKEENTKIKLPILSSSIISLIKENNTSNEILETNKEENKENIDMNKNEIKINEHKNKFKFKLLNKKRITFDVIRYESPTKKTSFECKRKDYFNYLNKYKTKKYIRNMNVFFE